MGIWDKIKKFFQPTQSYRGKVTFDDESVKYFLDNSPVFEFKWGEVDRITIRTTDEGPFVDDVFQVYQVAEKEFIIPSETEGADDLAGKMTTLPDFNEEEFFSAMSCTENQEFICWEKKQDE